MVTLAMLAAIQAMPSMNSFATIIPVQFGISGLSGADATLPVVEVQGVDQEFVKTEMPVILAVM